jgi:hypothetical protein
MTRAWKHRLLEKNTEERTGICSACGPVKIWSRGNGGYVCAVSCNQRSRIYNQIKRQEIGYTKTQHRLSNLDLDGFTAWCSKCDSTVEIVSRSDGHFTCKVKRQESLSKKISKTSLDKMFKGKEKPLLCALCGEEARLVRDHCHVTQTARDWICYPCNIGLGQFKDEISTLEKAIEYLKLHQGQKIY